MKQDSFVGWVVTVAITNSSHASRVMQLPAALQYYSTVLRSTVLEHLKFIINPWWHLKAWPIFGMWRSRRDDFQISLFWLAHWFPPISYHYGLGPVLLQYCPSYTRNLPWKSVRTQTHSTVPLASIQRASNLRWLCDTNAWSSHGHAPYSPLFSAQARRSVGEQLSADGNRLLHLQTISAISMHQYGAAYAQEDPPKIQHGSWWQHTPQTE